MKVYKGFMFREDNYRSLFNSPMSIIYKFKEKKEIDIGYAFAFYTLENLITFLKTAQVIHTKWDNKLKDFLPDHCGFEITKNYRICICEAETVEVKENWIFDEKGMGFNSDALIIEMYRRFWRKIKLGVDNASLVRAPVGTVFCKTITLKEDVTGEVKEELYRSDSQKKLHKGKQKKDDNK